MLQTTFWSNPNTPLTTTSLQLTYILLPPSHQHLYQLPLDETFVPFHPHIFPLYCPPLFPHLPISQLWMWTLHLFSTLTSCLDRICPLSSRPARAAPSNPWLSDVLREHRSELRAAERKWHKSKDPSDLSIYQSLLSSFSAEVHTAEASYFHNKISSTSDTRKLFITFNSLLHHLLHSWWLCHILHRQN